MNKAYKNNRKNFLLSHGLMGSLLLAFFGFFVGILLTDQKNTYHEISLKPAVILDSICLNVKGKYPDSVNLKLLSRIAILNLNADTENLRRFWMERFHIDIEQFPGKIRLDNNRIVPPVKVIFYDTAISAVPVHASFYLPVKKYTTEMFFAKYPAIALWASLIVIQIALYFFLLPYAFVMFFGSGSGQSIKLVSGKELRTRLLYLVIIILLFVIFFRLVVYRSETIHAAYFMDRLNRALTTANIIGYVIISMLLTGVIVIGNELSQFDFSSTTPEEGNAVITEAEKKANDLFLISAIILSMAVFSTGTLFSGLNSLDFVKQLNKDRGYTVFTNDAVYLYGLLHSFILILFFAPVKRIIANIKSKLPSAKPENESGKNIPAFIASPMKTFIEVVVSSSPLLASLLQSMIEFISKQ